MVVKLSEMTVPFAARGRNTTWVWNVRARPGTKRGIANLTQLMVMWHSSVNSAGRTSAADGISTVPSVTGAGTSFDGDAGSDAFSAAGRQATKRTNTIDKTFITWRSSHPHQRTCKKRAHRSAPFFQSRTGCSYFL